MAAASSSIVESCTVETTDGAKLHTRLFKPPNEPEGNLVIVLVHPYSVLGGCQALLRVIALGLAQRGWKAVTFDMRGAGRSTGRPSLTGSAEIRDVIAVCNWAAQHLSADRIILVGSSAESGTLCQLTSICGVVILMTDTAVEGADFIQYMRPRSTWLKRTGQPKSTSGLAFVLNFGSVNCAPISGSAVDQVEQVVGYVSIGYPFGWIASILFGRHHKAILQSPKPKLFIMGTSDGFTSVKQLENKLKSAAGRVETHLIQGVGHFQMEGPAFDDDMVNLIIHFVESL